MSNTIKVKVVKCSNLIAWYVDKVGEVFNVIVDGDYYQTDRVIHNAIGMLLISDCEIIPETLNIIEAFEYLEKNPDKVLKNVKTGDYITLTEDDDDCIPTLCFMNEDGSIDCEVLLRKSKLYGWEVVNE
jgi:hypothetical protein